MQRKTGTAGNKAAPDGGSSRFPDGFRILQGKQEYVTYIEHSSIRVWHSNVPAHFASHKHSAVEIILPQQGVAVYQLDNEAIHVQPGEILILPPGCSHALTEPEDISRYLLLFEPNALTIMRDFPDFQNVMREPVHLNGHSEWQQAVGKLLMQAVDCYNRKEPLWNTECYSYLIKAYALLGRYYIASDLPAQEANSRKIESAILNSAITFINEHYMDDISLEDVAVFAGFSKYYFCRMFKQFSGLAFSEFLIRKRLNVASEMLIHTELSVKEIAMTSGFGSIATFNRVFRENKHCTPLQFRAIYGSGAFSEAEDPIF